MRIDADLPDLALYDEIITIFVERLNLTVPALDVVSLVIIVPTLAALILVAWFGKETRGRDLRELDPDGHTFAATGM